MRHLSVLLFFALAIPALAQYEGGKSPLVKPGIEVLLESQFDLIKGKRIGLITNHTGINSQFEYSIDLLHQRKDCQLVALFCPEHGLRGELFAGERMESYTDSVTSLPVYSLYGKQRKPTPEMLKDIDVLLYDIQDIGVRAYTFIYTMSFAMEAAKENNLQFVVLDRPCPMGGNLVDGNVLEPDFASFLGRYPIAYIYGMTPGELARFFNAEFNINCNLEVVKMGGWRRHMKFWDTGLPWVATSGGIPRPDSPFFNGITGIIGELQMVNEGVGTTQPFEYIGEEWIDPYELADELNSRNLPGLYFQPTFYTPRYYVYKDKHCRGVKIHITDFDKVRPYSTGIHLLEALIKLYPEHNVLKLSERTAVFDKVVGTDKIRLMLLQGKSAEQIIQSWQPELTKFLTKRQKYLLYQ